MLFEVGDDKAEAKTSQALREGLDVRASKSSSGSSQKKSRKKKVEPEEAKNKDESKQIEGMSHPAEAAMSEYNMTQREGPPPQHEGYGYPPYYHGNGGYEDQYCQYPYEQPQHTLSRKRPRAPPPPNTMYHYPAPPYQGYAYPPPSHPQHPPPGQGQGPPPPPHSSYDCHAQYQPPPSAAPHGEEDHGGFEMDFSPPRGLKREDDNVNHFNNEQHAPHIHIEDHRRD